jgi:sensor c-di-GMP phosphodiesterase-like protein
MAGLHKYKWLAAVLGVLLTGAPVLWFTTWLQKQGEAEVSIVANGSIGITELIIDEAVARLKELADRGVDACRAADLEALRKTVFASGPIKELSVIGPNGQTLCTDTGSLFLSRDILATAATANPDIVLDVVRIAERDERMLRVRRLAASGKPSLAALLWTHQLLPRIAPEGSRFTGYARMTLADGTLVGVSGTDLPENALRDDHIVSRMKSERYGPIATVVMLRNGVIANYDDLRRIGMVVTGLLAFIILVCALIVPWRQRSNPLTEIQDALAAGEFIPYYQPIVDITSGKLLGAEVLVRWRKPDGTIVSPGSFIPLVERNGLVLDLTRSLMRQVCKEAGPALGLRPQTYIAFNIAPNHFNDAVILNDVGSIFEGSPIRLSQVVLELTERCDIDDLDATSRIIAALQGLGCKVALDDIGTGRNGLSYILKLGVDIIKIDKLFIDTVETEGNSQAIVGTLIDLARTLRMRVIAEGVEHFGQVEYLRAHGVTAVQGYIFAPPLPGSAFLQLIDSLDPLADKTPASKPVDAASNVISISKRTAA